jgi:hypothetical protein
VEELAILRIELGLQRLIERGQLSAQLGPLCSAPKLTLNCPLLASPVLLTISLYPLASSLIDHPPMLCSK